MDAEVLFPNTPTAGGTFFYDDADYELACVQAYNDALAEWRQESDRYVPLAIIPYLSPIETIVAEVERSAKKGHGGIVMLAEPSKSLKGLKHSNDSFWDPLWAVCQDHELPIHWHGSSGLATQLAVPPWKGYSTRQFHIAPYGRIPETSPAVPLDVTGFSFKLTVNTERDPDPVGPPIIGVELVSIAGTIRSNASRR